MPQAKVAPQRGQVFVGMFAITFPESKRHSKNNRARPQVALEFSGKKPIFKARGGAALSIHPIIIGEHHESFDAL